MNRLNRVLFGEEDFVIHDVRLCGVISSRVTVAAILSGVRKEVGVVPKTTIVGEMFLGTIVLSSRAGQEETINHGSKPHCVGGGVEIIYFVKIVITVLSVPLSAL